MRTNFSVDGTGGGTGNGGGTGSGPRSVGRTVAVLGGGGFVGRELVGRLVASGHVVRVGSRNPESDQALARFPGDGRVEFLKASVNDAESLERLFNGADAGINLVSIMSPDVKAMHRVNVEGARLAALVARQEGVEQYMHMSAIGASLQSPGNYGRSKGLAEQAVRAVFPEASLLRPSVIFGPEDSFFNMFALMAKLSPVLPVFAPNTHFQPVYVGDVAKAAIALVEPGHEGMTVEAGGPDVLTMKELMEFVLEASGRHRLLVPVPDCVARMEAEILEPLPGHLLTRDQVVMMGLDNVVQPGPDNLQSLGITPTAMRSVVPDYLKGSICESWRRFRK
ncbi:complex I NDUFA9 subunit family protein [Gluconobacter roseus]|uniref:3-beta-hydroxy-Delta(5)-steroid dehydrogenase n=1 Tax=Gluconobacter roseus NBRC 3990 TaxID=1307950 RepID=A0A4Y3M4I6_9PROT|nr:complex I NDUFA9 subunit family protein [Gluconobacter roseus]KXV44803.1 oxidoreductase [Gluconobacter roseus]GBR45449.1 NADH-ubiquinone oxidoreductase 39 kDa subunit [Gluconobacter roseus NBRC 3990]GEB02976.1 3-beta-hydroxy-Delta(5)-steroid dehydrogenase [Gluconobacter roseus NBRC 3990]GLP93434.1 3-beta-hydroxy-Delta(5)-steroid dehydrogenase [Gluconobacter roseus NBRC 3990]